MTRARSRARKIDRVLDALALQHREPRETRLRLRSGLARAVAQATWTKAPAAHADVFVSFPRASTSTVWKVSLGDRGLFYPSVDSHRNLDPDVELHASPGSSATLATGNALALLTSVGLDNDDERVVNALRGNDEHWLLSVLDWLRMEEEADTVSHVFRRRTFVHDDGRRWSIFAGEGEVLITIEDEDGAVERRRPAVDAVADAGALIAEQLADGFVEVTRPH
jgi:hypothetical protein